LLAWDRELTALKDRLAPIFRRSDVARSAGAFIDGLLSGIPRKTGLLMAEQAGLKRPYRMQSALGRSSWEAEALRDRVRVAVIGSLGDRSSVLVVDFLLCVWMAARARRERRPPLRKRSGASHPDAPPVGGFREVQAHHSACPWSMAFNRLGKVNATTAPPAKLATLSYPPPPPPPRFSGGPQSTTCGPSLSGLVTSAFSR
jgi:hypothetical protein